MTIQREINKRKGGHSDATNKQKSDLVIEMAIAETNISKEELVSGNRERKFVRARKIISLILKKRTTLSYQKIADLLNMKNHSSVMHQVTEAKNHYQYEDDFKLSVDTVMINSNLEKINNGDLFN